MFLVEPWCTKTSGNRCLRRNDWCVYHIVLFTSWLQWLSDLKATMCVNAAIWNGFGVWNGAQSYNRQRRGSADENEGDSIKADRVELIIYWATGQWLKELLAALVNRACWPRERDAHLPRCQTCQWHCRWQIRVKTFQGPSPSISSYNWTFYALWSSFLTAFSCYSIALIRGVKTPQYPTLQSSSNRTATALSIIHSVFIGW